MKFREETLGFRLLLKPYVEKVSKGGIVIARDERSQAINTDKGEVLMIGPNAWSGLGMKPDIKPGDTVFYAKWGAKLLQDPEDKESFYILCNDEDILVGYTNE